MSGLGGLGVDWTRVMFGENSVQIPLHMTVQWVESGVVMLVGASRFIDPHPLLFGSGAPHVHVLGDAVVRPSWVGEADLRGRGATALLTGGHFADPALWTTILGAPPARGSR